MAVDRTLATDVGAQQCSSPDGTGHEKSAPSCRDSEKMSALVADLVGRSVGGGGGDGGGGGGGTKSTDSPFNVSAETLIRAASGAVGRGADALKTVTVNGLVLLTETVRTDKKQKTFFFKHF